METGDCRARRASRRHDLAEGVHNASHFPILVDAAPFGPCRDGLCKRFKAHGILGRRHFHPLISSFPMYEHLPSAAPGNLPVANAIAAQVLCRPIYAEFGKKIASPACKSTTELEGEKAMAKRVLFLGASAAQIPPIKYARDAGYYVVTADYLPENPGHQIAHETHNVSTTDKQGILELARRLRIDGIVAYASEPASPTAAYVAEKLGLPGNSCDTVDTLTRKDRFRAFLAARGFASPNFFACTTLDEAVSCQHRMQLPVVVKPVDSCGSKGVSVVDSWDNLPAAFEQAMKFSLSKRTIMEAFVGTLGEQITGEGFVYGGKLLYVQFAKQC